MLFKDFKLEYFFVRMSTAENNTIIEQSNVLKLTIEKIYNLLELDFCHLYDNFKIKLMHFLL
jgi:hypothetical protein